MNGKTVEIGGVEHILRWECGPVREFETLHPAMNGAPVAWQTSAFQSSPLFALWHMALRCHDGNPKMTDSESEALLQAYLDEGHVIEEARDLIGEAGVAGGFLSLVKLDAEVEGEESPTTPEDGTTAPAK